MIALVVEIGPRLACRAATAMEGGLQNLTPGRPLAVYRDAPWSEHFDILTAAPPVGDYRATMGPRPKLPIAGAAGGPSRALIPRDVRGGRIGGRGEIAQLVEHATENCGVLGSSPSLAIASSGGRGV
jgi:hypothetical protein